MDSVDTCNVMSKTYKYLVLGMSVVITSYLVLGSKVDINDILIIGAVSTIFYVFLDLSSGSK
jgi:uncharacterized membrane protein YGL010W